MQRAAAAKSHPPLHPRGTKDAQEDPNAVNMHDASCCACFWLEVFKSSWRARSDTNVRYHQWAQPLLRGAASASAHASQPPDKPRPRSRSPQ